MLSIEEIKLLKEKLERLKGTDWERFLKDQIRILTDLENAVDANNTDMIDRLDKTLDWYRKDLSTKKHNPVVDLGLYKMVQTKIFQFSRTNIYNSLEIGPGNGTFSKEFRTWKINFFVDVLKEIENKIRRRFPPAHQKHLRFYTTDRASCDMIPKNSCNFVFSWDTFVFFTQKHIEEYLQSINDVLIDGGYVFIQYADCHFDLDLKPGKKGILELQYKNGNGKTH